jgi:hypothetical protein
MYEVRRRQLVSLMNINSSRAIARLALTEREMLAALRRDDRQFATRRMALQVP